MLGLVEIGHFALALALGSAVIMAVLPMVGSFTAAPPLMQAGRLASIALAVQTVLAFGVLMLAFIRSDFSVALVASHSHSLKPMLYKITGVWGNHEGSLLLWVGILAVFSLWVAVSRGIDPIRQARVLSVQGIIATMFLLFMLATSNPFLRLIDIPLDGTGLNPLLQDPGLAFHPPMLYFGYVGLSVAFSFAVAALIEGDVDKAWARQARPFILLAWSALTLGIALGSWWAYYELGWGGWWFWDPVENVSLMPWLVATALIHCLIGVEKQGIFKIWTVLLALMGFALSLLGTFIVRSGLLTSVHAFASDPDRGLVILLILGVSVGLPLILFAWRGVRLASHDKSRFLSRETALAFNTILLVVATATVLIGTLYPLMLEAWNGAKISVGPPFFNATFAPIMGVMVVLMAVAPLMAWGRASGTAVLKRITPMLVLVVLGGVGIALLVDKTTITALATISLGLWLAAGVVMDIGVASRFSIRRIGTLPLSRWGMNIAHLGAAVFILGAAGVSFYGEEAIARLFPGEVITAGSRAYRLESVMPVVGANYTSTMASLSLLGENGEAIATMISELRFYPVSATQTTEAGIRTDLSGDAYVVLGQGDSTEGFVIRVYDKPLIHLIWLGAGLMALGGILAIGRKTPVSHPNLRPPNKITEGRGVLAIGRKTPVSRHSDAITAGGSDE